MASNPPIPNGSRLRQIGWAAVLGVCLTVFLALTFHVNAVKSEVRLAERQIIALQREKLMLETEFQTRASQRQLAAWNAVEFGYQAPRASQYLEGRQQLAKLGTPRAPGSPEPIRVALAPAPVEEPGLMDRWGDVIARTANAREVIAPSATADQPTEFAGFAGELEGAGSELARRLTQPTTTSTVQSEARQ